MGNRKYCKILISLFLISTMTDSYAEIILTKNNKTIQAKIVSVTDSTIWYELMGGKVGISKDNVQKVLNDDKTISSYSPDFQIEQPSGVKQTYSQGNKNIPAELKSTSRMINKANQPALEWIKDEAEYVKKNNLVRNVSGLQSVQVGDITWHFIEFELQNGQLGTYKMKQYYTYKNDADPQLLEMVFAAKKDLFDTFDDEILEYLSNIELEKYFTNDETALNKHEPKLTTVNASDVVNSYNKGLEYAVQNKYKEASEEFNKILEKDRFQYYASDAQKIISDLNQGVIKSETAKFLFEGLNYFMVGQNYAQAASSVQKAIQADPDYAYSYDIYGTILFTGSGSGGSAIPYLKKALELDPQNANISQHLGICYHFVGQYKDARENLETAKERFQKAGDLQQLGLTNEFLKQVTEKEMKK